VLRDRNSRSLALPTESVVPLFVPNASAMRIKNVRLTPSPREHGTSAPTRQLMKRSVVNRVEEKRKGFDWQVVKFVEQILTID
jgi:hypothetical protein